MIYAVLLCDKNWKIERILHQTPDLDFFHTNSTFTELVSDPDALSQIDTEQHSFFLTFPKLNQTFSAIVRVFPEYFFVVVARIRNDKEFVAFANQYERCLSWAEDHLQGLYRNEYYLIQKMNNQLIDSQRALTLSNIRMEQAKKTATEALKMAEKANKSKSLFLANMSHDIRTPMNAIVGIARLMKYELNNPEKLADYLEKLLASCQHLLGLINDILDMTKIESGSVTLHKESVNLKEQAEQIDAVIRPQTKERNQTFTVHTELEHEYFICDPTHLRQILINILSNAVKYTPDGGRIHFEIREEPEADASVSECVFVVTDNGIGMTPEFQKVLFDSFTRAENSVTNKIQGTGLGMAITKNLVEIMGGSITVDSVPGKGSRFEVHILLKPDSGMTASSGHKKKNRISEKNGKSPLSGMKFLCAEDNDLNAEILESLLRLSGASCTVCSDGQQIVNAFEKVKPGDFDAILMDVQMPVMDGYEATKQIRNGKNPVGRDIPIIAMTANAFSDDIRHSLDCGMNAHISKPIDIKLLEEIFATD